MIDENQAIERLAPQPPRPGKWLAIETSGMHGSIAAGEATADACRLLASTALPTDARSAKTLAPAIHAMLQRIGWKPAELATIAVAVGPGSFTGLRVGVVTAKTMAYATEAAVLGVDTLEALAEADGGAKDQAADSTSGLWTLLDAQRGELFAARFKPLDGRWHRDEAPQRLSREALLEYVRPGDRVIGPIATRVGEGEPFEDREPHAEAVLQVAWRNGNAGAADNAFTLAPEYLRQSAAEEKLTGR